MPRPSDVGVGVAVAIVNPDGHVLLGRRKGAHGAGQWSFPGGWIDRADGSIKVTCIREVQEETGIVVSWRSASRIRRLIETSNDYASHDFRAITLFYVLSVSVQEAGAIKVVEPDKCEEWRWYSIDDAQALDLFGGVPEALEELRSWRSE